jgi:2-keto-4-pentenoate hydratase/2-oxohepta-3-ene-1,7-dioic acid hydratase in catechol pathway
MKLLRFELGGKAHLGVVKGEEIIPLDALAGDYPTMLSVIEGGATALARINEIAAKATSGMPLAAAKLLAPVEQPGKFLAIGMNYAKHVAEADKLGVARSAHQVWFNKQTTCLNSPFGNIEPGPTEQLDYEVELGLVIGKRAKNVAEADALGYIFGYFVANDVSARDFQFHSQTMTMGKSFDTHGPIGPWIVTADEVPDPQALNLRCFVNGEQRQSSNTDNMIHRIAAQIAYLTSAFTLEPGDLIATGTPEGVGVGMEPQQFLKPDDVVRCEIDGIGMIENRVAG